MAAPARPATAPAIAPCAAFSPSSIGSDAGARITLIRSGDRPAILAGPAVVHRRSPAGARRAGRRRRRIIRWRSDVRLARELAGRTGTLMVMSDMPAAPRGEPHFEGGVWVALGEPVENVGITAAQRTSAA